MWFYVIFVIFAEQYVKLTESIKPNIVIFLILEQMYIMCEQNALCGYHLG